MHLIDVLIIFAFIAYAISSGLRSRGVASQNLTEYFLAGRSLSGWKAGVSMAATQFAADTPLLVTGLIVTAGVFSLWRLWIYALAFLLMGFVLAAGWRRAGVLTDAELTEVRYGGAAAAALRGFKAVYLGTVFNCVVLAMVLLAAGRIAEPFLLWDQWLPGWMYGPFLSLTQSVGLELTVIDKADPAFWIKSTNNLISILAIVTVTTFYSTTGGLRSVVNTDVAQFLIMMVATACYAGWALSQTGGLGPAINSISEHLAKFPDSPAVGELLAFTPSAAPPVATAFLIVLAVQWFAQMNADGTGYLAQRSMACRTDRDARFAAVLFTFLQVVVRSLLWVMIAVCLFSLFAPDLSQDPEAVQSQSEFAYVQGMAALPVGLKGLLLTAMLAALASTVDTHLNWGSSYWTNDIYKRFVCEMALKREASGRELVWVARFANLLILVIALVVMTGLGSIRDAWERSLLIGAGVGPMLVLRWLWWRVNAWSEIATLATSLVMLVVLFRPEVIPDDPTTTADDPHWNAVRMLAMAGASLTAGVVAAFIPGLLKRDRVAEFYRRVRPMGFWGPIAREAGADPSEGTRRLGLSLLAMAMAAVSVFGLLIGIGSWLLGSPGPTWFPSRGLWIALTLGVGVGLIPFWWRIGFRELPEVGGADR